MKQNIPKALHTAGLLSIVMKQLLFILLLFIVFSASSQEHHEHEMHRFHFGAGVTGNHTLSNSGLNPGVHLHLLKAIGESGKWQIGLGYESVFADETHHSVNIPIAYSFTENITVKAGPGLTFAKHEQETEIGLAAHAEAIYEFEIGHFHLGPLLGFGFDKEDVHIGFGVHAGFGF